LQQSVQTLANTRQPTAENVATQAPVIDEEERAKRHAAAEQERAEYMDTIAQSFANERVDMRWSHATTTQITATIDADNALRDRVNGIECRGQTCKVVIRDDGSVDVNRSLPLLAASLGQLLPRVDAQRIDTGDGGHLMVLYMSSASVSQQGK